MQDVMLQDPETYRPAVELYRKTLTGLRPDLENKFSAEGRWFAAVFDSESERCVRTIDELAAKMGKSRALEHLGKNVYGFGGEHNVVCAYTKRRFGIVE